jgi:hypothetical protein|tara:strand:+ start:1222 stop:1416 length:195 start_codon:yes stop_codon:yes gene_type:complete
MTNFDAMTYRLTREILDAEAIAQDHWHNYRTYGDEGDRDYAEWAERKVRRLTLELELLQQGETR